MKITLKGQTYRASNIPIDFKIMALKLYKDGTSARQSILQSARFFGCILKKSYLTSPGSYIHLYIQSIGRAYLNQDEKTIELCQKYDLQFKD